MDNKEKAQVMTEVAKQLKGMIQKRMNNLSEANNTLQGMSMDTVPDKIKESREQEAAKNRAVIQEQKNIIDIIEMLFPDA